MKTLFLADLLKSGKEINDEQRENLAALLSKGCRRENRMRIKSICEYNLSTAFNPIFRLAERFYFQGNDAYYVAAQSYNEEIRYIREVLLK